MEVACREHKSNLGQKPKVSAPKEHYHLGVD